MNPTLRVLVVLAVIAAAATVFQLKQRANAPRTAPDEVAVAAARPKLLDLGADKCVPCKMMAPILDALREEKAEILDVVFIDVWKDREAGKPYGISSIPTQIFFDPQGVELFRHVGFYSREEILAKWRELGYEMGV